MLYSWSIWSRRLFLLHGSMVEGTIANSDNILYTNSLSLISELLFLQFCTPSRPPEPLPSRRHPAPPHANTHFNHLDFHYHRFLFSLLNLVPLTTETWTEINSLTCLHRTIAILAGFESSFQTQIFDVSYILPPHSQNLARLIRITLLRLRRDRTQYNCSTLNGKEK